MLLVVGLQGCKGATPASSPAAAGAKRGIQELDLQRGAGRECVYVLGWGGVGGRAGGAAAGSHPPAPTPARLEEQACSERPALGSLLDFVVRAKQDPTGQQRVPAMRTSEAEQAP